MYDELLAARAVADAERWCLDSGVPSLVRPARDGYDMRTALLRHVATAIEDTLGMPALDVRHTRSYDERASPREHALQLRDNVVTAVAATMSHLGLPDSVQVTVQPVSRMSFGSSKRTVVIVELCMAGVEPPLCAIWDTEMLGEPSCESIF
jgi:hypothetical protein